MTDGRLRGRDPHYPRAMERRRGDEPRAGRRTAYASLACTAVAGAVVLLEATLTDLPGPAWPAWWWVSYVVLVLVQLVATGLVPPPPGTDRRVWLPALVVTALGTFLLYPDHGLTAALIVVSAANVARYASGRAVIGVIVLQSVAAVAAVALVGAPFVDVVAGAVVYPGFQAFGALVVLAARRETEARQELARTHARLRSTMALLEAASRDAERMRIARDLHDVVGHQLTALAIELEVATHLVAGGQVEEHVTRARAVAKGLLEDVREAVAQMRLTSDDLRPALAGLAGNAPGIEVAVDVEPSLEVSGERAQVIVRCVQEAITNTLRHGGAARLEVTVASEPAGLVVRAADDGCGSARVVPGHGLTGMRERLESLGGSLAVVSTPGEGFVLEGRLPTADGPAEAPAASA